MTTQTTRDEGDARRAAVIGWPIEHSRSPVIHSWWLEKLGLRGSYERVGVPPEQVSDFLRGYATTGLMGGNVTLPHKEIAATLCDDLDEVAQLLGAVNTLRFEDGRLIGSNTDGLGFLGNLDHRVPGWDEAPGPAVVLGAGGGARAIVWALRKRGFAPVRIVNRTVARAQEIADRFGPEVEAHGQGDLPDLLTDARILVNTTSLGMTGQPPLEIDLSPLPAHAIVTDIVYAPLETGLLRRARERGLRTVDGLGMLLHQAVPGFEMWFGVRPQVTDELRAHVLADMGLDPSGAPLAETTAP